MSKELVVTEPRQVTVMSTRTSKKLIIMSLSTTWGALRKEIEKQGWDTGNMIANVKETYNTLHHESGILPEGPFTIFMLAQKQKGGAVPVKLIDQIIAKVEALATSAEWIIDNLKALKEGVSEATEQVEQLKKELSTFQKQSTPPIQDKKTGKAIGTVVASVAAAKLTIEEMQAKAKELKLKVACKTGKKEKTYLRDYTKAYNKALVEWEKKNEVKPPVKKEEKIKAAPAPAPVKATPKAEKATEATLSNEEQEEMRKFQAGLY